MGNSSTTSEPPVESPPRPFDDGVDVSKVSEAEWKKRLSPEEFSILRNASTERRNAGYTDYAPKDGYFVCKGCGNPLCAFPWRLYTL